MLAQRAVRLLVFSPQVPADALPVLPDLPLPVIQANYRPLPTLELMSSFPPKRKGNFLHSFLNGTKILKICSRCHKIWVSFLASWALEFDGLGVNPSSGFTFYELG